MRERPGRWGALAALLAALTLLAPRARAGIGDSFGLSPFWDWKTIETAHFRVTFPVELEETAQKEAGYLEEAHAVLSPRLYWQPWYKTQVLVIDNADLANGLTSPQYRLGLILWVTPPDPWFSTAYYDDWLRLLAFHEYTHLLNMDNVQDFYVPLRYLTGDVLLPNAAWPSWMLEGLAVYDETRFTHAGRGRSPLYEMFIRTAVDESVFDTPAFYKIDQFNGSTPYSPGGEAYYTFGYQLLNQVARTRTDGKTTDGGSELRDGEDALGIMSLRSAARIPFFINTNLDNILGKTWYHVWDEWVSDSRNRAAAEIQRIRSQPVTAARALTPFEGISTLGPIPSPDGRWLAYTSDTPNRRSGLYLLDIRSGGTARRLDDKAAGAVGAFTPDSRTIVYSDVERYRIYYQYSDLEAYDLDLGRSYPLTSGLRARDPDISPDGAWIVFTLTENQTTGLAIAPLERDPGSRRLRLGALKRLATTSRYDRVAAPRFSRDGKRIYYSLHRMGKASEELLVWDLAQGRASELVSNGKFNRYPAVAPDGSVYFVSDLSGVDNLYRLPADPAPGAVPVLATNVVSGLTTPSVGAGGELYAGLYSSKGWGIARLEPLGAPVRAADVAIGPPPAPQPDSQSDDHSDKSEHAVRDYSIFPSIWPRQWLLIPDFYPGGIYLQDVVAGFDAVDRHEYVAAIGYNTQIPQVDWSASYSNRQLGPTLSLFAADHTTSFDINDQGITDYTRRYEGSLAASYLIQWTYSSLLPAVSVGGQRVYNYYRGYDPANGDLVGNSPTVATADVSVAFSDAESARLSVWPEWGRELAAGVRLYADPGSGQDVFKSVLKATQYLHLFDHAVLAPSLRANWSTAFDYDYGPANAQVQGRTPSLYPTNPIGLFDALYLRGYPQTLYFARAAGIAALDFRMPVWQIFRGWGTNPAFLDNLYVFGFGEAAYFPGADGAPPLTSAGGGATLRTEIFLHIPVSVTVECDQGFESFYGGKTDLYFALGVGAIQL